jgi:hypothetical protein
METALLNFCYEPHDIETKNLVPSIHRVYALAVIWGAHSGTS